MKCCNWPQCTREILCMHYLCSEHFKKIPKRLQIALCFGRHVSDIDCKEVQNWIRFNYVDPTKDKPNKG